MPSTSAAGGPSKVSAAHLHRHAYLYVRQSTLKQVLTNTESTRRQYDLRGRAIALGWRSEQVIVIDIDQGHSGASAADREGFQRLVAEVSLGKAGIVLGLECSRLARNNADWHRLLEICALTGTLICDEDGLYDPTDFNDRMLLGMKGQISEAELHFLRARMRGGILNAARRGELLTPLPVGLIHDPAGRVVLDPDQAVQTAVRHLFAAFAATGSAHAVVKTFADQHLLFPRRHRKGPRKGELDWAPLTHSAVLRILHNPRYAGVFCYGRHRTLPGPDGKNHTKLIKPRQEWIAFLPGAHPGYITLTEFDANLDRLAHNAAAHGADRSRGPAREGSALLQGLIICGKCGQKMTVRYHLRRGIELPDYVCQRAKIEHNEPLCQTLPGADLDAHISALLLDALTPLAIEAALTVAAELAHRADQADQQRAALVERARYQADLARRRYLAVDPGNRLVADTLEADWNTALRDLQQAQDAHDSAVRAATGPLTDAQKTRISQLATDFPAIWNDPTTPQRERKRMAHLLISDVTITRDDQAITCHVRFAGGQDHTFTLPLPKPAWELRQTAPHVVAAIDDLLDHHTHAEIADILNARGLTSGEGRPFHRLIVMRIRDNYGLRSREQRLRDAGLLTLNQMANRLGVSTSTVKHWFHAGIVSGQCYNDKGQILYHPPGPNPPTPHHGLPKLADRRPAQTPGTSESNRRGAV
ncbi:recombinase family protein [Nonomuraea sp. NPDC049400]|uniref:recombinase family protein n=1 Tax=Nonomuraea sp. NPDC049400 TaxID=3364352 RepID=UPI00378DAECC